jgi:hypothetical protein
VDAEGAGGVELIGKMGCMIWAVSGGGTRSMGCFDRRLWLLIIMS